jgi:hypothetical protein
VDRCELTELLVDQCACPQCRNLPDVADASGVSGGGGLGPWFRARFGGRCDGCGDGVVTGGWLRADGGGGWLAACCGGSPL